MQKKYFVSNIYRPPEKYVTELDEFITEFSFFFTLLQHRIRTSFICGDFKVNLLEISTNAHFNNYFESINNLLLFPKGFSPGLPYQQEYNPRHLVLLITSFVMISVEQLILRLVCLSMIYRIIK